METNLQKTIGDLSSYSNYEYNYEVIYELTKKITKSSLRMTRGIDSSGLINNVSLENLKKSLAP